MSCCQFVPPYLLEALAAHATEGGDLQTCVRETLRTDDALRTQRRRAGAEPMPDGSERTVSDAGNEATLPGRTVRTEGQPPTGDAAVDEAYAGMGSSRALFTEVYGRDSLDDRGHPLDATVHYRRNYANAFWDGRRLVFGDGDGEIFERFTKPPDVIAHEFTHGVTQFSAALAYEEQAGSLNESVSDVFAALTVQRMLEQTADEASWLIGEGLFKPGVSARALRSMAEPGTAYDDPRLGKDPQPGHMRDFVETTDDNGGVHINSGIPNRAFYLVASALGGPAWEVAGQIWYATLTDGQLASDADFGTFAARTIAIAADRHGVDSAEHAAVVEAWSGVGVHPSTGHRIVVRRSGGFAGMVVQRRLDTTTSSQGYRVDRLLRRVDLARVTPTAPQPDAFVFSIVIDDTEVKVQEPDLPPALAEVVDVVLGEGEDTTGS